MKPQGMSLIVRTVSRLATSFILVFGCYLLTTSHHGPGGGFAFGVIAALAMMLVLLAFGRDVAIRFIPRTAVSVTAVLSVTALLVVGLLGYWPSSDGQPGSFMRGVGTDSIVAGSSVWLFDVFIGLLLGASVFAVLTSLSTFHSRQRHDPSEPKET